ncbi:MAG: imidazole glycerol phosphate synthase subunit HisH [Candidatus Omnitrophota bacterium]|jgi:glutamine amidotransferase
MIAIIDYGMGNIHSVKKALEVMGAETLVTNKPQEIKKCEKLVLPGVGAFGDAMEELKKQGLVAAIKEDIRQKKIFLGICLGMQLLFEYSEESPGVLGLGILKGGVKRFPSRPGLKVPHMGWNQLHQVTRSQRMLECPLLKGVKDNVFVYFCHSYYPVPEELEVSAAVTDYGEDFTSMVWKDTVFGAQFHPEKSQTVGLEILRNFVEL